MKKARYIFSITLTLLSLLYIFNLFSKSLITGKITFTVHAAEPLFSKEDVISNIDTLLTDKLEHKDYAATPPSEPIINASKSIILDLSSDRIIYDKNSTETAPMASTTKIMTFIIAIENCDDINDTVTISKNAAATEGSTMHLAEGETISLYDLLYGLMLNSGNDAAVAISEHIAGDVEAFADMMNKKAIELGAYNTSFKTPHGLDVLDHYTTAYDLALIAKEAYKIPLFKKIISTKSITLNGHYLKNTNPLLGNYDCVTGGKTGYTSGAGKCIVFFVEENDFAAVCVLLGCDSSENRVSDGIALLNYATNNFNTYKVCDEYSFLDIFNVTKGTSKTVSGITHKTTYITLAKWEESDYDIEYVRYSNILKAPIKKSELLGKIFIKFKSDYCVSIELIAQENVLCKTYSNHLIDIIETLPKLMV